MRKVEICPICAICTGLKPAAQMTHKSSWLSCMVWVQKSPMECWHCSIILSLHGFKPVEHFHNSPMVTAKHCMAPQFSKPFQTAPIILCSLRALAHDACSNQSASLSYHIAVGWTRWVWKAFQKSHKLLCRCGIERRLSLLNSGIVL